MSARYEKRSWRPTCRWAGAWVRCLAANAAPAAPHRLHLCSDRICLKPGENATSHRFDMHGGTDRGDGTEIAGDGMHIHHDWFAQSPGEAVASPRNIRVYRNLWGPEKTLVE